MSSRRCPFTDPSFAASARDEAQRFLLRTQTRACLAVLCGNSEVEMQPSLLGQPAVSQPFFHQVLPELTAVLRPDVPYVGSSPSQSQRIEPRRGCSHYYGVGAYQRPLRDARLSQVRFASECLGFAQRPAIASREAWHDEPWAQRIVRANSGVGDFVDVHEYYMREYFQLEPLALRSADRARYDALSEILPGEVMAATFAEWRSHGHCQGGLVWLWRDGWRSCGWGIIDADGRAKPAYHYLRRALAPHAVFLIDEGLNGLDIHLLNESDVPHQAELTIELYLGARLLDRASAMQVVAARGHTILSAEALLGRFADLPFAYRYGARPCDTVVVRWGHAAPGFHFLADIAPPPPRAIGLTAVRRGSALHVSARELARTVILECEGASDNYFHLAPGEERVITVPDAPVRVSALSATESVRTT